MKITVRTIAHSLQRYPTAGDWFFDESGDLHVNVSELGNPQYEALVAVHEIVEALLCRTRGIPERDVDAFDRKFAAEAHDDGAEPGDDPRAPYRAEHCFATGIERLLCAELGLAWALYDATVEAL